MTEKLVLSTLPKTWIFDVDGTIVVHNGHLQSEGDQLLDGVADVFKKIPRDDKIIFLTARTKIEVQELKKFLRLNGIRFDLILSGMPVGERIIVNDRKPSGLKTAYAVNKDRDKELILDFVIDRSL